MKRIIILSVLSVLSFGLIACQESLEDRCAREAKEYTQRHCPFLVSRDIMLDSMTFDKTTHTITYVYTVKGVLDDDEVLNRNSPRTLLLQEVRNSTNLKLYKEAGYNFCYVYYSAQRRGKQVFSATFTEKDYR